MAVCEKELNIKDKIYQICSYEYGTRWIYLGKKTNLTASNFISNLGYSINEHISLNSVPVLLGLIGW